jgi:hypothetical protein
MSDLRPDSAQPARSPSVPVPDFTPIVKQRRSPFVLILSVLAALVAAALFILASTVS